jgi:GNAT superfamily N-acetyltransferase
MSSEFLKNSQEIVPRPIIEDASVEDIENILTIQSQKIIIPEEEMAKPGVEESGFLVYPITNEELGEVVIDKENYIVKVAKENERTIGYIISYDMAEWEATHPNWFSRFKTTADYKELLKKRKVLYGRHIAVDENISTPGVGKDLLDFTLQEAVNRGYEYYVVEVLKEPIVNKRSANFVQKTGFALVGQLEDDKRIWSVFLKDLTK